VKDRGTSGQNYSVLNHNVKVILGDLNYKIDLDSISIKKFIASKDYEKLHRHEEFSRFAQQDSEILKDFKEAPLYFDPTYKYQVYSNDYDASRVPGWTDRILYEAKESFSEGNLKQILYTRVSDLKLSTHRPVVGLFEAKIRKISEDKMQQLEERLITEFNQNAQKEESKGSGVFGGGGA